MYCGKGGYAVDATDTAPNGQRVVERARAFAKHRHGDQLRKYSKQPYIVHLDGVVRALRAHGIDDPHVLAAAYLHDTVEDTETTIEEVYNEFGEEIARLVYWLTDAEKGRRKIRKIMSAWRLGGAPWDAKIIKLADFIDNTDDICKHDRHFAPVYLAEKRKILESMVETEGAKLTSLPIYQEASKVTQLP
jgi:GTP diphosphokinase / guanosine-3',5'-bis(diphosphate) 3'-diphosphatase